MTSPETLELEAVDAALAGRYVAPEHAELADLALLLRDDRPQPTLAFATHLDRRVEAGFPARPKQRRDWRWLRQVVPVVALVAIIAPIVVLGALNNGSDDIGSGGAGGGGGSSSAGSSSGASGDMSTTQEAARAPRVAAPPSADSVRTRRVQRAAEMTLAAPRRQIDHVSSEIGDIAADARGFVAHSRVTSSEGGDFRLRVPSRQLETVIQRLSKVAKVRGLSRSTQDITRAFVSARAGLADARAERTSLLKQLAAATTLNETESIRARLRDVSREIALARNELRRVSNRANFATIIVTLVVKSDGAGGGGAWTPGDAWHDALRVLEVVAGVLLIAAAVAFPLLLAGLLGWLARRGVTRRRRERALDMA